VSANLPGVGQRTWDTLVSLGFLEERREGASHKERPLKLTEKVGEPLTKAAIRYKTAPARPRSRGCWVLTVCADKSLVSKP
jgi:hypothetical protein